MMAPPKDELLKPVVPPTPQEFRVFLKQLNGECTAALERFEAQKKAAASRGSRSNPPSPTPREKSKPPSYSSPAWTRAPASIYEEKREFWEAFRRQLCNEGEPILRSVRTVKLDGPKPWGMEFAGLMPGTQVLRPEATRGEAAKQEPLLWERTLAALRKTVPEQFRKDAGIGLHRPLSPPQLPRLRVRQVCPYLGGGQRQSLSARRQEVFAAEDPAAAAAFAENAAAVPPFRSAGGSAPSVSGADQQRLRAVSREKEGWVLCSEGGVLTLGGRACVRRPVAPAHARGDGPETVKVSNDPLERLGWRKTQWCTMVGRPLLSGPCVLMSRGPLAGARGFEVEVELAESNPDGTRPQLHLGLTTISAFKVARGCAEREPVVLKELMEACNNALSEGWLLSTNGHRYRKGAQEPFAGPKAPTTSEPDMRQQIDLLGASLIGGSDVVSASGNDLASGAASSPEQRGSQSRTVLGGAKAEPLSLFDAEAPVVKWPERWRPRPFRGKRSVRSLRLALHPDGSMELLVEGDRVLITEPDFVPRDACRYQTLAPVVGSGRNVLTVELRATF